MAHTNEIPTNLPFLTSICWDLEDIGILTLDEMLARYERGWHFNGVLADLEGDELRFVRRLAQEKGSWMLNVLNI